MGNDQLAQVAREGIVSSWAPTENSWCQKFARLCLEHTYGSKYDVYMKTTANLTGRAFQAAGLALTAAQAGALQPGDLLYKCPPSGYGHVGIYVGNGQIAENSSAAVGRVRGALGYRTVAQFGAYDLLVRLPEPAPAKPAKPASLILAVKEDGKLNYIHLQKTLFNEGHFSVDVAELAKVLVGEDEEIRPLLTAFGWNIYQEGNHLDDPADPRKYLFIQKNLPVPEVTTE